MIEPFVFPSPVFTHLNPISVGRPLPVILEICFRPASSKVGISGRVFIRFGTATAMAFKRPALIRGLTTDGASMAKDTMPAMRSVMAGAVPL